MKDFVITPDKGVEAPAARSRGRPKDETRKRQVQAFLALPVGDSFFVPDAKRRDLEYLRKPVTALGANIEIHYTEKDEIYQVPGTRCWRRHGLIDEL